MIKPSKYAACGHLERFRRGYMPNATLSYLYSMTVELAEQEGFDLDVVAFDEYVQTDLDYLRLLDGRETRTLVALVGVQSHQFHRALDLAAMAHQNGAMAVIGGPHAMTCDTSAVQNRGISFALAEAELVWGSVIEDALKGELQPVYGSGQRWQRQLDATVQRPPSKQELKHYVAPMLGVYPARGCPFRCNFCSVIKIAGRNIRAQSIDTTLQTLRLAKEAGVKLIMFTSDNFNKIPAVRELLQAMIDEKLDLQFFAQCDTQIGDRDADLIPLLARAGCFQIFIGVESYSREILKQVKKYHNHPDRYHQIVGHCREYGVRTHFSNIIGFPGDTESGVREHMETLKGIAPNFASFYILTPIPGTEQYDDFLEKGTIFESNLDRFDGTCTTWYHDNIRPSKLRQLLFDCYRDFYGAFEVIDPRKPGSPLALDYVLAVAFTRFNAFRRTHPMSGGVWRVRRDHLDEYLPARKAVFGLEQVPLPTSLELSEEDESYNRLAKLAI